MRQLYRAFSCIFGEIKWIIQCSRWQCSWLVLLVEAQGWFIIISIYWKRKRTLLCFYFCYFIIFERTSKSAIILLVVTLKAIQFNVYTGQKFPLF